MTTSVCTIGLDIGTTSVKALVVDDNGTIRFKTSRRLNMTTDETGMAVQDALEVATEVTRVLQEAAESAIREGLVPLRVGFSAAMHSLMAVSEDGSPLTDAMTWMDGRAEKQAEDLWARDEVRQIYRENGTPIHAMSPFVKLDWLRQTDGDLWARRPRFTSLKEFVWHRWFGEWEIDESMAGATGLFHLANRQWNDSALAVVGIRAEQLSTIVPNAYTRTGLKDPELLSAGLTPNTRFTIGGSDGVLANLALGVTDSAAMVLTAGTSLAVRTGSTSIVTTERFRPFCYLLDTDRYIVGAPSNSGGVVLDWLTRTVFDHDSDTALAELCKAAADVTVDGLFCLPYVAGERAPLWDASARASFVGLHVQHGQVHLIRAAIEGMLFNAYWLISNLIEETGKPERIILSGKLFDEEWIGQFCADLFEIPVQSGNLEDASTLGAIALARAADGFTDWDRSGFMDHGPLHRPDPSRSDGLRAKFSEYRRLCQLVLNA